MRSDHPNDELLRVRLAEWNATYAYLYRINKNTKMAKEYYEKSISILRNVLDVKGVVFDLIIYQKLFSYHFGLGDAFIQDALYFDDAIDEYEDAMYYAQEIERYRNNDTLWKINICSLRNKIAKFHLGRNSYRRALTCYKGTESILKQLLKKDKYNLQFRMELAVVMMKIGDVSRLTGDLYKANSKDNEAIRHYELAKKKYNEALKINKILVESQSTNKDWKINLVAVYSKLIKLPIPDKEDAIYRNEMLLILKKLDDENKLSISQKKWISDLENQNQNMEKEVWKVTIEVPR